MNRSEQLIQIIESFYKGTKCTPYDACGNYKGLENGYLKVFTNPIPSEIDEVCATSPSGNTFRWGIHHDELYIWSIYILHHFVMSNVLKKSDTWEIQGTYDIKKDLIDYSTYQNDTESIVHQLLKYFPHAKDIHTDRDPIWNKIKGFL